MKWVCSMGLIGLMIFSVGIMEFVDGLEDAYVVDDVDYCIEQAKDMVAGVGDFAVDGPQPNQFVDVTVLDRGELLAE